MIAVYKGCAIEKEAKKTAIIPNIKINTEASLDNDSIPLNMPTIPTNISTNAIK